MTHFIVPMTCFIMLSTSITPLWSFIFIALAALSTTLGFSQGRIHYVLLDASLLACYLSSCISTALAYDISTALPQLNLRTFALLLYLACRRSSGTESHLILGAAMGMIVHCGQALWAFYKSYQEWVTLQFSHLVDFRSFVTLTGPGTRPGNHNAIYIIAIILGLYEIGGHRRLSRSEIVILLSVIGMSLACVLLSFSRSLYLSALVCLLAAAWEARRRLSLKQTAVIYGVGSIIIIVAAAGLIWIRPVMNAIIDTGLFGTRLSHQLSVSGRISIYREALDLVEHCGWFGAGVSNYTLALRSQGLAAPSLLTAHAFNVILECTIEQGRLGFVTLVLVLWGIIRALAQRFLMNQGWTLSGGFIALLLYSMSQTFVIADQETATSLAVFCSVVAGKGERYA